MTRFPDDPIFQIIRSPDLKLWLWLRYVVSLVVIGLAVQTTEQQFNQLSIHFNNNFSLLDFFYYISLNPVLFLLCVGECPLNEIHHAKLVALANKADMRS